MGGRPLAMVDVLSIKEKDTISEVTSGMNDACIKFGVPIVGGHIHPDSSFDAVDVAILGTAKRESVIYSHTADVGDTIIFAVDLDGRVHPNAKFAWDTTLHKSNNIVRKQLLIMSDLGSKKLVKSGKDISNPGALGTLGMLLESSKKGATIDLPRIPSPDESLIEFKHWLKVYQGCGFVVSCEEQNCNLVLDKFKSVGLTASIGGKITEERKLVIEYQSQKHVLFDFDHDKITGL
jgi:selenophosphate synthetase-related protein